MAPGRMRRLDRLILDAVQRLGPTTTMAISDYVVQRRWCFLDTVMSGPLYVALMRLEDRGWIASRWDDQMTAEELARRGGRRRRLYWATPDGMAQQ